MQSVIRGKICTSEDIDQRLKTVGGNISNDLSLPAPATSVVVSALDKLGKKLASDRDFALSELTALGMSRNEALEAKRDAASILEEKQLYTKLKRELSAKPCDITRISARENYLGGYMPLGVLGHVTSSNDAFLPFLSAVEGLITGNINIVKTATGAGGLAILLASELCVIEPRIEPYLYILPVSSKESATLTEIFALCDGVAVWGSENAVKGVSELAPSGVKIIAWGHRISFCYVTQSGNGEDVLCKIARDVCVNDQQACSAPQVVYFETESKDELKVFGRDLFSAMQKISPEYRPQEKSEAEQAEITSQTELMKLKELMGDGAVFACDEFRVFVNFDASLETSPLYRTVLVKPIKRSEIIGTLRPYRSYLQSAGLAALSGEINEISGLLYKSGVTRVTSAGKMAYGYTGEPHDGVFALMQYVRRVSLENENLPLSIMDLNEMRTAELKPYADETPVLRKADFTGTRPVQNEGYLLLKSGGSSGQSVYAPHTYTDAETTYATAGRAMFAAGIKPDDIVMNLFYSGSLYGGFISMYEGLKYIDAIQLPMTASMDFDFVTQEITANKVNVAIGMPSYLLRLFTEQEAALKAYGGIEKILYGGEHIDEKQINRYKEEFGVKSVKSLVYGCNELGSIGYVCEHCEGSEHHLFGSMYMEILRMDSDEAVSGNETGRIVLTPFNTEDTEIRRYEIGDLGRFITEPCACGRTAPKFELLGRFGDTFKFATNYVNYNEIQSVLSERLDYAGRLQIVLEYKEKDTMKICVELNANAEDFMDALKNYSPEIKEAISDNIGSVMVVPTDQFAMSSAGGKVRKVVDLRK